MNETFIVITGSPVDGHRFIGPFNSLDEAIAWGKEKGPKGGNWWTVDLESPAVK